MNRFKFRHVTQEETGFILLVRLGKFVYAGWIGYGKPVWWKPRFLGCGEKPCIFGFGFGWLLLCFQIRIVKMGLG